MGRRKNAAAVTLGRRGGRRGGPARAAALTTEQLAAAARNANRCRYDPAYRLEVWRRRVEMARSPAARRRAEERVREAERAVAALAEPADPLGDAGRGE